MKPITINVSAPVYKQFQLYAKHRGRKVSELIREAMELFLRSRIENRPSIKSFQPFHLKPVKNADIFGKDLLGEMLEGDDD